MRIRPAIFYMLPKQVPTFPTEIQVTSASFSSPTLPPAQGAAVPEIDTHVLVSLSDLNQISDRFGDIGVIGEYVSPKGVLKEQLVKAVKEAALVPRSIPFEIFNRNHLNACRGLVQVLYCKLYFRIPT